MTVHQYDIVLDVTVINRTGETLQNLCLELATMGDLKLVERPQNYTLSPGATKTIRRAPPHARHGSPASSFALACILDMPLPGDSIRGKPRNRWPVSQTTLLMISAFALACIAILGESAGQPGRLARRPHGL